MPHTRSGSISRPSFAALAALAVTALSACPTPPPEETPDAGEVRPDVCNSLEEALQLDECHLTLGQKKQAWLSFAGDEDWYSFTTPADANARTLVHVTGGYPVANTAVNLSFNVLRADGTSSLVRKSDRHGQAKPQPIDIILPFAEANQKLVLLVSDDPVNPSKPNFDVRAQYELAVDVLQDPDVNEPNDTQPTEIALTSMSGVQTGTQTGYLATENDVDTFRIDGGGAKKVLYLHITGPELNPPPPYQLSYVLQDAEGNIVADGTMANALIPVDLATARLAPKPPYTLTIKGHLPGDVTPVPGDLRLQYQVEVRILGETDPSEGPNQNDTADNATVVAIAAPGQSANQTGRLGYAGDQDWFAVQLASNTAPTVLHFKLTPGSGPARFPRLPGFPDRELRVLRTVQTGGTLADDQVACRDDDAVCPRSFGNDPELSGLHQELCGAQVPRCLHSLRREHPEFEALANFEGTIPVPPHTGTVTYLVQVLDQGNNYADDVDYTLAIDWRADPDDAAHWSGGVEQPRSFVLAEDAAAANFPHPPSGQSYELSGRLSHGYAYFRDHDPNDGDGVRGPADYDAVPSDVDSYVMTLPALDPLAGPLDRTWELEWEVQNQPNGGAPYDLVLELEFCDGDNLTPGGQCTPVKVGSRGGPLTLSYTGDKRNAWHNPNAPDSERQPVYLRDASGPATVTTAAAYGCFCFEPRFIKGGTLKINVLGVDRSSYADLPYTLRMAYTDYPKSYATDGGMVSCPPPVFPALDGGTDDGGSTMPSGCWFTREP
ncbi:MAG: cell-cell cohesion protein MtsF [Myxococcaceae bacterium]|nr:cell-cell cohesion protein MtsF [Myxococcaceae bacterium]